MPIATVKMIFSRTAWDDSLTRLSTHYEKSAPTVADWADRMAGFADEFVTLADIHLVDALVHEYPPANYAANQLYHHQLRLGRDTTGLIGF